MMELKKYGAVAVFIIYNRKILYKYLNDLSLFIYYHSKLKYIKSQLFYFIRYIPFVETRIKNEIDKNIKKIVLENNTKLKKYMPYTLSTGGLSVNVIKNIFNQHIKIDRNNADTKLVSGTIYNDKIQDQDLVKQLLPYYYKTNPLHTDTFPSLIVLEKDIIEICKKLFNAPKCALGTITSGGTESILLACYAYKKKALKQGIKYPEIIAPITVHAAFDKACDYFSITLRKINVDPMTNNLDKNMLSKSINQNTILLVGSAPSFPHGLIDDIEYLSGLAIYYNLPLHVDACLGGFLLPFIEKTNITQTSQTPKYDFCLEGVTSISADTHKYGLCPKGTSVLLYRNESYMENQYFIQSEWTGGIYATTNMTGSRSGLLVSLTWAVLQNNGFEKYRKNAEQISKSVNIVANELKNLEGIIVYGEPKTCIVGIGSDKYDIYGINSELKKRGWDMNELQNPASIHFCITVQHTKKIIDKFIDDFKIARNIVVEKINTDTTDTTDTTNTTNNSNNSGASIYGTTQKIPDKSILDDIIKKYLNNLH